jgi:hypothetical protein
MHQHPKFFVGYFGQPCNNFIHFVTLSPHNTCIMFPNSSLGFLANYTRPTSIIGNTHIVFPNSSLGSLDNYAILGHEMSIVVLTNYVIFVYLHVFPIQILFICEYCMRHVWHVALAWYQCGYCIFSSRVHLR